MVEPFSDRPPGVAPPRIAFFERLPVLRRVRVVLTVMAAALVYGLKFEQLQRALGRRQLSLPPDDRRRYQLRRRYAAGAAAGYLASRYSLRQAATLRACLLYADIAALWSNFLIAADAAMDTKSLSRPDSIALLGDCFHALYGPVEQVLARDARFAVAARYADVFGTPYAQPSAGAAGNNNGEFRFERYAIATASGIGNAITLLQGCLPDPALSRSFSNALSEFYLRALDLAEGQLASLDQTSVDEQHDWGWYTKVMDRKLVNVLLTPFSLCVGPSVATDPAGTIGRSFFIVNRVFFHRQVLDDLVDFEEDLSHGAANSLVFMLVSQGRIAAAAQSGVDNNKVATLRELGRSGMLMPEFGIESVPPPGEWAAPEQWPQINGAAVATLVKAALVNNAADRAAPLDELVAKSLQRKAALLAAWASEDRAAVTNIVQQSGIATRILDGIARGRDHDKVEQALVRLGDDNVREIMYLFYVHTLKTYRKCVAKWRPETR